MMATLNATISVTPTVICPDFVLSLTMYFMFAVQAVCFVLASDEEVALEKNDEGHGFALSLLWINQSNLLLN